MSNCKICDILFVIFCLLCFVFYVNPSAFSSNSNIKEKRIAEVKNHQKERKALDEEKKKFDIAINQCKSKSFQTSTITELTNYNYSFDVYARTCNLTKENWEKSEVDDLLSPTYHKLVSKKTTVEYSVDDLADYSELYSKYNALRY